MKKMIILLLVMSIAFTVSARDKYEPVLSGDILGLYPNLDGKAVSDITVNDILKIAENQSVTRQENKYVKRAAVSSFLIPGTGQFMIGEPLTGTLHLTAQLGILGGAAYGAYLLMPQELKDAFGNKSEVEEYFEGDHHDDLLPAAGVMAGGLILSILNSHFASRNAADTARNQIETGRVSFEPNLAYVSGGWGIGFRMRR